VESFNKWFWGEFDKSILEFSLPDNFYGIPSQPDVPEPEEQPRPKKKKRRKRQKYINRKRRIRK
jgi:hypothetical protein